MESPHCEKQRVVLQLQDSTENVASRFRNVELK